MLSNKNKPQQGGKFIAAGTYGCVYRPTIRCKGETNSHRKTDKVSKLMTKKEANKEYKEFSLIEKIDPKHEFHLPKPTKCDNLEIPDRITDNLFLDCNIFHKNMNNVSRMASLTYENGGDSLSIFLKNILKTNQNKSMAENEQLFLDIFFSMENIFYGLHRMYESKFVHFDIKTGNIVIKKETQPNGNKYKINYIDYGMSGTVTEISKKSGFAHSGYFAWPFEIIFYDKKMLNKIKNKYFRCDVTGYINRKFMDSHAFTISRNIKDKNIYTSFTNNYDNYSQLSHPKAILEITKKIDVFSVGVVLIELWQILGLHFVNDRTKVYLSSRMRHRNIMDSIHELITLMTESYYGERLNGTQVYEKFCEIKREMFGAGKAGEPLFNIKSKKKEPPKSKPVKKAEPSIEEVMDKQCPEGKVLNPKTGRCVSATGAIAKKLGLVKKTLKKKSVSKTLTHSVHKKLVQKLKKTQKKDKDEKECPPGKVLNPTTNRCIKADGAVAKKLGLVKTKKSSHKPSSASIPTLIMEDSSKSKKTEPKTVKSSKKKTLKKCPPGKILNVKTNRCIKADGAVAKKLGLVKTKKRKINKGKLGRKLILVD
jgi:serine/threonine protein kinase